MVSYDLHKRAEVNNSADFNDQDLLQIPEEPNYNNYLTPSRNSLINVQSAAVKMSKMKPKAIKQRPMSAKVSGINIQSRIKKSGVLTRPASGFNKNESISSFGLKLQNQLNKEKAHIMVAISPYN